MKKISNIVDQIAQNQGAPNPEVIAEDVQVRTGGGGDAPPWLKSAKQDEQTKPRAKQR